MEPSVCREQLRSLIVEESQALAALCVLLQREHQYLLDNDAASLEGASRERQRCVARIFRVDEARRSLCSQLGHPLTNQGLEQLMRWCDPQATLAPDWARCSEVAGRCRQQNDCNGALVSARLKSVQARLGTLIESRREAVTYGPRGAYAQGSTGSVLATEV